MHTTSTGERYSGWVRFGLIFAVCLLTYGLFIHRFGIYYDDWVTYYLLRRFSFGHLLEMAQGQSRAMHAVLMGALGTHLLLTHAAIFAAHVANTWMMMRIIGTVWPAQKTLALFAALLAAVYPAYWFRPVNIAIVTEFSLTMALFSWLLGVWALRTSGMRRYVYAAGSMLLIPCYVLAYELPFGVEPLRLLMFFALIPGAGLIQRLKNTLMWCWPWILTLAAVGVYRVILFEPTGFYASVGWNEVVGFQPGRIAEAFAPVFVDQILRAWALGIYNTLQGGALAWGIAAALGIGVYAYGLWQTRRAAQASTYRGLLLMLGVGVIVLICGQLTQMITLKPPQLSGWLSRWNQISMIGAALIWISALTMFGQLVLRKRAALLSLPLIALLIAIGGGAHVFNAQIFADEWDYQRSLLQQMSVIAPTIEDDTLIVIHAPQALGTRYPAFASFGYDTMIAVDLFYNQPGLTAILDFALDPEQDGFGFDNGAWGMAWPFSRTHTLFIDFSDPCARVVSLDDFLALPDLRPRLINYLQSRENPPARISTQQIDSTHHDLFQLDSVPPTACVPAN